MHLPSADDCSPHPSALRQHCHMQHVAAARGSLHFGYCSLTPLLQVIIIGLLGGVCLLFVPLSLQNRIPLQTKHWLSSQQDPCCCQACIPQKKKKHPPSHLPPPLALLRSAQLSGEWRCIEASCINLPLSGQRHRGTVGASPVLTQSVCSSNWC